MTTIPVGARRCSNNCGAEWHYAGTTCPKENQAGTTGAFSRANLRAVANDLNAKTQTMTDDDAVELAEDAMADALDDYWDNSEYDEYDTAMMYCDRYLPEDEASDEDREMFVSDLVDRFEEPNDILEDVRICVDDSISEGRTRPDDYANVSFTHDDVKRHLDSAAQSVSEFYGSYQRDTTPWHWVV